MSKVSKEINKGKETEPGVDEFDPSDTSRPSPDESSTKGLNSYRSIIRGSSFFGGVQVFNIIVSLVRGKFVAIILGPEGMGVSALFNSASNTIQRFSSLGLNQSIVREVALKSPDPSSSSNSVISAPAYQESVIRASLLSTNLTALLGMLICVAFCIPLSRLTFGDISYWWQFMILGIGVFFAIGGTGKLSVLQGLHQVKRISRASIVGGLTGLGVGVPLYYLFGDHGIVPAIVAIFLSLYIFYSVSLRNAYTFSLPREKWRVYWPIIRSLLALGIVLMSGDVVINLVTYLINLFVRLFGNIDDVGLYQAANSVTSQYSGVIFSALAMDYFPRLSNVSADNSKMREVVNRQSEIVSWLITPAMSLLILSAPLLIRVLLSESFHSIIPLMRWMGIGMLLRAFSFPMAYITFAKGNKKVFFLLESVFAPAMTLILSCLFFRWFGLIGLGYALVADNGLCFILYYLVNRKLYSYNFSRASLVNFMLGALLAGGCFVFSFLPSAALSYSLMSVFALLSIIYSFLNLRKKYSPVVK